MLCISNSTTPLCSALFCIIDHASRNLIIDITVTGCVQSKMADKAVHLSSQPARSGALYRSTDLSCENFSYDRISSLFPVL